DDSIVSNNGASSKSGAVHSRVRRPFLIPNASLTLKSQCRQLGEYFPLVKCPYGAIFRKNPEK
ncbi:hypothetical protein, partial [Limnobacter sp.]|uniref:hypothetical protein n=1 Tax=Limnobacter sp. TaxID=2003368 RepID=UPI002FE32A1E